MRLVAARTPSRLSAWKKNSKAWQVFLSRREWRAGEVGPEPISEDNYVLDDFAPSSCTIQTKFRTASVTDK